MKLLIIISHEDNAKELEEALVEKKYTLTKLESKGGFLKKKNATFLMAVEDKEIENVEQIVKKIAKTKEETISAPVFTEEVESVLSASSTVTVKVGGATIFVLPLEKMIKM